MSALQLGFVQGNAIAAVPLALWAALVGVWVLVVFDGIIAVLALTAWQREGWRLWAVRRG